VENGEYNRLSLSKFFYMGPMFRAERPQRGRLRQFNQFGAELFGSGDPYHDFEVISMMDSIARKIGLDGYSLHLNSIGCPRCRQGYISALREYYSAHEEHLCKDCRSRLGKNALRLLDCKVDSCREIRKNAPLITSYLDDECRGHHEKLKQHLMDHSIDFIEDPFLVRGLDYYTRTTFEFVADRLGGQNAFAAGGRYDQLVEEFEGRSTPAVGFAAGIERLLLLLEDKEISAEGVDVFIIHTGDRTLEKAALVAAGLRAAGISCDLDPAGKSFKPQFKKAEREKARFAVIIGEDELSSGSCQIKNQSTGEQKAVPFSAIAENVK
jgi:histidyl-tRNA synthetase